MLNESIFSTRMQGIGTNKRFAVKECVKWMDARTVLMLLIIGLVSCMPLQAQEVDVEWGEEIAVYQKGETFDCSFVTDSGSYLLVRERFDYYLERYDRNMHLVKRGKLDLNFGKKRPEKPTMVVLGEQAYLLTSVYQGDLNRRAAFSYQLDLDSLTLSDESLLLAELNAKKTHLKTFDYRTSPDGSKLLVMGLPSNTAYFSATHRNFEFFVFDQHLNLLWEKKFYRPDNSGTFHLLECSISDSGTVHLAGYKEMRDFLTGFTLPKPSSEYIHYSITKHDVGVRNDEIALSEDRLIGSVSYSIAENGNLVLAGTYFQPTEKDSTIGVFTLAYDDISGRLVEESYVDLPDSVLTEVPEWHPNKNIRENFKRSYTYSIPDLIWFADGSMMVLCEEIVRNNFVGNLIAFQVEAGAIQWTRQIPKQQFTLSPMSQVYDSYLYGVDKQGVYMIYNGGTYMPTGHGQVLKGSKHGILRFKCTYLNRSGDIQTGFLNKPKGRELMIFQEGEDRKRDLKNWVFLIQDGKYSRLGTLKIKSEAK